MIFRLSISAMFICAFAACSGPKEKAPVKEGLLPASLVNNPRTAGGIDTAAAGRMPVLQFADTVYDFGTLPAHTKDLNYEFRFTNTGNNPLMITDIQTSCGCTAADFPRDPVLPGQEGKIAVRFKPGEEPGHQEKTVVVSANTLRSRHVLYIRADIQPAK